MIHKKQSKTNKNNKTYLNLLSSLEREDAKHILIQFPVRAWLC